MWWWSYLIEKSEQVPKLPMRIACHDDRRLHIDYYWLLLELWDQQAEEVLYFLRQQVGILLFI